jgi:hypothetical protein
MVDPRERAKLLLQAAVVSDPLNPAPFVELAAHAPVERIAELACEYLEAARNRLNPVDATTVVLVSLALLEAEEKNLAKVVAGLPQSGAHHALF